ncbi:MAG: hypothetical protein P4N60_00300 [Verrucomicrobiae bacterium]|nr:hypothetical protein [Verrucomicrobiae bacterium]
MKMLKVLLPVVPAFILLTGCDGGSSSSSAPVNPADVTNSTLVNAKRTADKTIDVSFINQAIQLYNVQEGRLPKTLEELVPKYVAKIPDAPLGYKIAYDAKKGEASVVRE